MLLDKNNHILETINLYPSSESLQRIKLKNLNENYYIDLNKVLPIILYIALIVLVITLIVLIIRLMKTLKKVDGVLDDVNSKMEKVDGVFTLIDQTTEYANSLSDRIINSISNFVNSILKRKKKGDIDE